MKKVIVKLENFSKKYGDKEIINNIDLADPFRSDPGYGWRKR